SVCPMQIPLPKMMRHWREREFERHLTPATVRANLALWAWFARRPGAYRVATRAAAWLLGLMGRRRGRFPSLPFAGGCAERRDLPLLRPLAQRPARGPRVSRDAVLGAIRRGMKRGPLPADIALGLRARLDAHPRHLIPARSAIPRPAQIRLFIANVEKEFGTV